MKQQKVLSLVLAAALCVSTPASAMAADFTSGPEDTTVQVTTEETTEAVTEDAFTDSTDGEGDAEVTDEAADATEFAPEAEDGEDDATLNAEAGSDIDDATSISLNTKYTGVLSDNNDADFYCVTLNEAGLFNIKGIFRTSHIRWRIYDDFGTRLDSRWWEIDSLSQRGSFEYSWYLTKGTYYVSIDRDGYTRTTGAYSFSLGFKSANESFSEDQGGSDNTSDEANEITFNKTYKGLIALNDDTDWYKFSVPKAETIKFIARAQQDIRWEIYEEVDGIMTSVWDRSGGHYSLDDDIYLNPGDYYLAVWKYYDRNSTYQFKLQTHTHSWKNEVTKATLTENGTIIPKCSCGETGKIKTIYRPKTIRLSKTRYKYNGYAQKPTVKVIGSDGKVISPSYYKVTYSRGLTAKGKYTVKITFKGRYSGSVKKYFKIV